MSLRTVTPSLTRRVTRLTPLIVHVAVRVGAARNTRGSVEHVLAVDTVVVAGPLARVTVLVARFAEDCSIVVGSTRREDELEWLETDLAMGTPVFYCAATHYQPLSCLSN